MMSLANISIIYRVAAHFSRRVAEGIYSRYSIEGDEEDINFSPSLLEDFCFVIAAREHDAALTDAFSYAMF